MSRRTKIRINLFRPPLREKRAISSKESSLLRSEGNWKSNGRIVNQRDSRKGILSDDLAGRNNRSGTVLPLDPSAAEDNSGRKAKVSLLCSEEWISFSSFRFERVFSGYFHGLNLVSYSAWRRSSSDCRAKLTCAKININYLQVLLLLLLKWSENNSEWD